MVLLVPYCYKRLYKGFKPIGIRLLCIYLVFFSIGGAREGTKRTSNSARMAAVLGMFLVFKTVVSHYRSTNRHLKDSKWKEKA